MAGPQITRHKVFDRVPLHDDGSVTVFVPEAESTVGRVLSEALTVAGREFRVDGSTEIVDAFTYKGV